MTVLIVGSVALDSIETPHGSAERALGGSASYASLAAQLFVPSAILGVVGADFPSEHVDLFREKGINAESLMIVEDGKTFHWAGRYHENMNDRDTLRTDLNVLATHHPDVPEALQTPDALFLANTDPDLQMKTLSQVKRPRLVLADTMNLWIETKCEALWELAGKTDVLLMNDSEAQMLFPGVGLVEAGRQILDRAGLARVIIKKGEHGSLMISNDSLFIAPAYPLRSVCDPTGAGDTFAGAYLGCLMALGSLDESAHRRAIIAGTCAASHNCESFGVGRLRDLTLGDILDRCEEMHRLTDFESIDLGH